ncbi:MAG: hypothetical protein NWF06_00550 [Candidatus Bathyarchaeota archaeon]|nr:hypothetical protein [Candidatus Bathyarchaeum sp.]
MLSLNSSDTLSYMELMNILKITNTGRFNYHLKILNELIEKRKDGKYCLTEKGRQAIAFLENHPQAAKFSHSLTKSRIKVSKKFVFASILVMLICLGFLLSVSFVKSFYEPKVEWEQFLLGVSGNSVIQTVDGGYLALGTNASVKENSDTESVFVNQKPILVKTDFSGNVLWTKTYPAEDGRLELSSIIQTSDGGYALGGIQVIEDDFSNQEDKICLIKIDSQGNIQWSRLLTAHNTSHSDVVGLSLESLIQTGNQGYALVAGYVHTMYISETWFVKTDTSGNLELNKTIAPATIGHPLSLTQTDDGYVILGSVSGRGGSGGKVSVTKIDPEGNIQWYMLHGENSANPKGTSGTATNDSGYIVAGYTYAGLYGWIIKMDNQGNMVWNTSYSYSQYPSTIQTISQANDGGYIFVGSATKATEFGVFDPDTQIFTWIAKIDSLGNIQKETAIEMGNYFTNPDSVIQTNDNGYAFVGTWNQTGQASNTQRFWFIKTADFTLIPTSTWTLISVLAIATTAAVEIALIAKFFPKKQTTH